MSTTPEDATEGETLDEVAADPELDFSAALESIEEYLLGEKPSLTRTEVSARAGVSIELAKELWRLSGFPEQSDDAVAFTSADAEALRSTQILMRLGVLGPDSQAALVRTWGRSFARLAEWEAALLGDVVLAGADPEAKLGELAAEVIPRVDALQSYIWRRHLAAAASRMLDLNAIGSTRAQLAICFVDIVGYTSRSKSLDQSELVEWLEHFEHVATGMVIDHGGRVVKTIGDEILFVTDDPTDAATIALALTARGADEEDDFPAVRAGIAYGEVVNRLGDVFGPVVNVAARLTSVARPGSVLVDVGAYEALSGRTADPDPAAESEPADEAGAAYRFRRMRRTSVKGYSRLQSWVLRPARSDVAD
ncbi:adenylate/guanylate cyclase domain-containing protein [Nocardioides sp.]|uniref:adenylate/guanylate cyclase domain-containing protein n=1 Tax=Nocardioides sp. TaxID=35761 RepID=UPI003564063A